MPPHIYIQLTSIKDYISNVLFDPSGAEKRVRDIVCGMKNLSTFPERGFNADKKVGKQISKTDKTLGILVADNQYLVFYTVDGERIYITHLIPTKSDYSKLFI